MGNVFLNLRCDNGFTNWGLFKTFSTNNKKKTKMNLQEEVILPY
jgi:hypothetical protein